jgi:hypothetical protein
MIVAICNVVNGKEKCQTGKMPNHKVSKFCDFDLSRWPQCVHKRTKKPDNHRHLGRQGHFKSTKQLRRFEVPLQR